MSSARASAFTIATENIHACIVLGYEGSQMQIPFKEKR